MRPGLGENPRIEEMLTTLPEPCGSELPRGRAHAVEDARLHDGDGLVPGLVGGLGDRRPDVADAGVVDDDVEAAEVARHRGERARRPAPAR